MSAEAVEAEVCIRQPLSTWTRCRCAPCRLDQNRKDKHRRIVGYKRTPWQDGWAVLVRLADAGWSGAAIADAYGLPLRLCQDATYEYRAGRVRPFTNQVAAAFVRGPIRRPRRGFVPAVGSTRRLQGLAVLGWTLGEVHDRTGITGSVLADAQAGRRPTIAADAANLIADLYEPLSARRGPSTRATFRALKNEWVAPLAWDEGDLDDPDARPHCVDNSRGRPPSRRIEELAALGCGVDQIAAQLRIKKSSVERALQRAAEREAGAA